MFRMEVQSCDRWIEPNLLLNHPTLTRSCLQPWKACFPTKRRYSNTPAPTTPPPPTLPHATSPRLTSPRIAPPSTITFPLSSRAMQNEEERRALRLAAAVSLVSRSDGKVSVRKAAQLYGISKSTVHRYYQAARRRALAKSTRPNKCGIPFLIHPTN